MVTQNGRPFIDQEALAFPIILRFGKHHSRKLQLCSRTHARNIEVTVARNGIIALRPDEIALVSGSKGGRVQRKAFHTGIDLSTLLKMTFQWIVRLVGQREDPMIEHSMFIRFGLSRGKVDHPFVSDAMNLGCPNIAAHGSAFMPAPDHFRLRSGKFLNAPCPPKLNPIKCRDRGREIVITILRQQDVRIGALKQNRCVIAIHYSLPPLQPYGHLSVFPLAP